MVEQSSYDGSAFHVASPESMPAQEIMEPDLSLEGVDFSYIADKFASILDDDSIEWIRAGVDDDGQPLTTYELFGYVFPLLIEAGLSDDETTEKMAEAGLLPDLEE